MILTQVGYIVAFLSLGSYFALTHRNPFDSVVSDLSVFGLGIVFVVSLWGALNTATEYRQGVQLSRLWLCWISLTMLYFLCAIAGALSFVFPAMN